MAQTVGRWLGVAVAINIPGFLFWIACVLLEETVPFFERVDQGGQMFCERTYLVEESIMCQKTNGLTSFCYALTPVVVSWMWGSGRLSASLDPWGKRSPENVLIILIGIYQVIGNLSMHGFCLSSGGLMDGSSMNMVLGIFFAYAFARLCNSRLAFWAIWLAHTYGSFFGRDWTAFDFLGLGPFVRVQFNLTLLGALVVFLFHGFCSGRRICRPFVVLSLSGLATFVAGWLFWSNGQNDSPGCNPTILLQPHGAWHALTALSVVLIQKSFSSDGELEQPKAIGEDGDVGVEAGQELMQS